ncbi:allantoate deiminase [Rhodovulum bhavnagarense]|uniref:Allantoate deiminase n=1 Tax=Rhodovulum bhavnagarense TaxID=992286 RepID=A0A4R2RGG3_9RHOB|nr:M20 family metallo-hydrolase [Rhodovulum bhavnagarense]TCP61658.1 allantoate deiminase [Rhodovulum bhavnagarense]
MTIEWGQEAARRLERLAGLSEPGPGVSRLPFTPQHRAALDLLTGWMGDAGLSVELDDAGTLVGRLDGPVGAGTFYLGSHQDSVREGGAYDGIMGVVLSIVALEKLRCEGVALPFAVEVLAFADEEGVRFPTALIGSRALASSYDPDVLDMADADGITLREAMTGFGLDPARIPELARPRDTALGYLETHIEQGPVLEAAQEALGIVTAICGIERHAIRVTGATGHAGTLPMEGRRDALVGAAALVAEVRRLAMETPGLRGTVGALSIRPNVVNAVPREAVLTAEFRSARDTDRQAAGRAIHDFAAALARHEGLRIDIERTYVQPAQPCDADLSRALRASVVDCGGLGLELPSGATHDASAMADLCPIAMLFVRCRGGVSHSPEEYVNPADLDMAIRAIARLLAILR